MVIELGEIFDDEVDEDTFEDYEEIDDIGDFAQMVWQERLEKMDFEGRIMNLNCYKVDDEFE